MTLPSERTPGPDHAASTYEVVDADAVEPKTKAATAGAGAGAVVSAFINYLLDVWFYGGPSTEPDVPIPVSAFVGLVVVAAGAFIASYYARHVNRA